MLCALLARALLACIHFQANHLHIVSNIDGPYHSFSNLFCTKPLVITSSPKNFCCLLFSKRADIEVGLDWSRTNIGNLSEVLTKQESRGNWHFVATHLDRKLSCGQFNPKSLSNSLEGVLGGTVEVGVLPPGHLAAPHAQHIDDVTPWLLALLRHVRNSQLGAECGCQQIHLQFGCTGLVQAFLLLFYLHHCQPFSRSAIQKAPVNKAW